MTHEFTDDITCPYCDAELTDPWEYGAFTEDETCIECPECERTFASYCHISYSFTTHEVDVEAEKAERERMRRANEERRAVAMAEGAKFTPGTRVRVSDDHWAEHSRGRVGSVSNKELSPVGVVSVDLDPTAERPALTMTFGPDDLERVD